MRWGREGSGGSSESLLPPAVLPGARCEPEASGPGERGAARPGTGSSLRDQSLGCAGGHGGLQTRNCFHTLLPLLALHRLKPGPCPVHSGLPSLL